MEGEEEYKSVNYVRFNHFIWGRHYCKLADALDLLDEAVALAKYIVRML